MINMDLLEKDLSRLYARGKFRYCLGNDVLRYALETAKAESEAQKQIEDELGTDPTISGKVLEIIRRPSSQGYPLGDPRNNDSIVIKCDKPNTTLTLMIPLLPEWEVAEKDDYIQFFAADKYYKATLRKRGDSDEG
jgi:hypothetical protein